MVKHVYEPDVSMKSSKTDLIFIFLIKKTSASVNNVSCYWNPYWTVCCWDNQYLTSEANVWDQEILSSLQKRECLF